ncbi:MAG TPA: CHASE2 domain-containing protein, partial [Candidatus Obscuribacterales bacterium]
MTWAQLRQQIWKWRGVLISAPSVAFLVLGVRMIGWLQPLEWAALDQYFMLRPVERTDPRIVIVGINELDIKKVGNWPLPDGVL